MSVLDLCRESEPVLRGKAKRVARFDAQLRRLATDLTDTMHACDGIGIAAPQVGRSLQLFVACPERERGREVVVANPIISRRRGRVSIVEGCLSVPNVWERLTRAFRVHLTGQDLKGEPLTIEAQGLLAVVLQHEVDHLQGVLFIDRLPWYKRRRLRRPRG